MSDESTTGSPRPSQHTFPTPHNVANPTATLIGLDDHNVRAARERVAAAGLTNVEVIEGDASTTDIYQGRVPAEIVLVCGLFGNLSDADIRRTIRHLPMLCTERACVLWTRGGYLAEQIRSWFIEAGFEEVSYTELPSHSVGVNRFVGTPTRIESGIRLFTFTSSWTLGATEDWLEIRGLRLHYRAWVIRTGLPWCYCTASEARATSGGE